MMQTVASVNWMEEADALCGLLDANGIAFFLPDRGMATTIPLYANSIGGIRIQVKEQDLERARGCWRRLRRRWARASFGVGMRLRLGRVRACPKDSPIFRSFFSVSRCHG